MTAIPCPYGVLAMAAGLGVHVGIIGAGVVKDREERRRGPPDG